MVNLKNKLIGILIFASSTNIAFAQTSFSISDSIKTISFPANEYVFYTWVVLTNNTSADLNLRWVRSYISPLPPSWSTQVQVLDSIYPFSADSADFVLPAIAGYADYALVFFYPNNVVANCITELKIYNTSNPNDNGFVTFHGITTSPTDIGSNQNNNQLTLYPNPANNLIYLSKSINENLNWVLYNELSQKICSGELISGNNKIELKGYIINGMHILELRDAEKNLILKEKIYILNSIK